MTLTELLPKLEEFSYKDRVEYFILQSAREFLQGVYVQMCKSQLSVRARNFVKNLTPRFEDLVPFFDAELQEYRQLCPGQNMPKTLTEIFNLNKQLKNQFDNYWQMSDDEVQAA